MLRKLTGARARWRGGIFWCAQEYTITAAVAFAVTDTRYTAGVANLRPTVRAGMSDD